MQAQFIQGTAPGMVQNPNTGVGQPLMISAPMWRPVQGEPYQQVIDIAPSLVVLEYNCYYMRDICKNAENWFNTPRGQSRTPRYRFAYDFNTGKGSQTRKAKRRVKSCNNFKSTTTCPHTDQGIVMRHDGAWRYKALEPGTTINEIKADVWPNGNRRPSEVRYTCDEFPPATWMEGGNGSPSPESAPMDPQTRCAAFRCDKTRGVKAEQNWQGTSHNALLSSLRRVINNRNNNNNPNPFPFYRARGSVVFFEFRYNRVVNFGNGVAAKVYTYTTAGQNPPAVEKQITQAKRDILWERNATADAVHPDELHRDAFWRWADQVSVDELVALGPQHVSEQHVLANHTAAAMHMPEGMGMPWMDFVGDGEDEDYEYDGPELPDVISGPPRADPNKAKRAEETPATPLLKDASASDIEKARKIVEDALAKSAELNAARLANPARNSYKLKPGTVVGGAASRRRGIMPRADAVEAPPPLLDITDEIAAAAALVSEADAAESAGNATTHVRRQAAGSGTFWMEHIVRMGTVPWGDDPSYKVFRNVLDYGAKGDGTTVS